MRCRVIRQEQDVNPHFSPGGEKCGPGMFWVRPDVATLTAAKKLRKVQKLLSAAITGLR